MNKHVQSALIVAAIGAAAALAFALLPAREEALVASLAPGAKTVRSPDGRPDAVGPAPAPDPAPAAAVPQDRLYETERAVAQARAAGAHENEVYRLRAASLSARDIAILHEREQAEKEWNRRIAAWSAERARLQHDPAALQALQDRLFSKEEQTRLGAYTISAVPQLKLD